MKKLYRKAHTRKIKTRTHWTKYVRVKRAKVKQK
jgi:hypothetical protein